jgi:hypothetical protein
MNKKDSEIIREAIETISDPERWTQGVFARDAAGREVGSLEDDAVCFCALGAMTKSARAKHTAFRIAFDVGGDFRDLVGINDKEGREAAIEAMTERAEKLEARGE